MELLNKGRQYILLSAPFSLRQEKIKKSEVDRAKRGMLLSVRARRWEWKRTRKLEVVIKSGGAVWQIER